MFSEIHKMSHSFISVLLVLSSLILVNCDQPDRLQSSHDQNNNAEYRPKQQGADTCSFRATILEYNRIDLDECHKSADYNLVRLEEAARLASQHGSQLIVFPEDAIEWGQLDYLGPCLEEIPEPANTTLPDGDNPCKQPELFGRFKILTRLSCIAKQFGTYVVANYGTRETCNQSLDKDCPKAGFRPLNTNVVFEPTGKYIARYRKFNPFIEVFEKAPRLEHVYFDTPFGRFGVFTCFDILFKEPSIGLVEDFNIDTAIFPTLWYDELPILTALQFQDAWSARHQVNLLASNILKPSRGTTGSGIFSGNNSIYVGAANKRSKILIANLPRRSGADNSHTGKCPPPRFNPLILDLSSPAMNETYVHRNYEMYFDTDHDTYLRLESNTTELSACARRTCCHLELEYAETPKEGPTRMVMLVRDARRRGRFPAAEQVCILATLDHDQVNSSVPLKFSETSQPEIRFKSLNLTSYFNTQYVYPMAAHNVSHLLNRTQREFNCAPENVARLGHTTTSYRCSLILRGDNPEGIDLYSFGLYGRVYNEDEEGDKTKEYEPFHRPPLSTELR